jgi:HSP20 family molecular chaperone IbpA
MATTLARWRTNGFLPLDVNTLLAALTSDIRIEQILTDGRFVLRAEIPGVDIGNVELTVLDGAVRIEVERIEEAEKAHTEFRYGKFSRTVTLPATVREETGKATYTNGILEIEFELGGPKETGRHIAIEVPKGRPTAK